MTSLAQAPTPTAIADLLRRRFNPAASRELDATIEFDWGSAILRVGIHDGALSIYPVHETTPAPELVVYFGDASLAHAILSGTVNPIDAFMQGRFSSNGNLVWVFHTLAAFSKPITG